jgi:hypothetical protein
VKAEHCQGLQHLERCKGGIKNRHLPHAHHAQPGPDLLGQAAEARAPEQDHISSFLIHGLPGLAANELNKALPVRHGENRELLKETGVVTVPGSGFGRAGEGYMRLSYATSEENIARGLERIRRFMESRRS